MNLLNMLIGCMTMVVDASFIRFHWVLIVSASTRRPCRAFFLSALFFFDLF